MNKHTAKTYFVYSLTDPRDDSVYYVGQTINHSHRLYSHIAAKDSHAAAKVSKQIQADGFVPKMEILDQITTQHHELVLRLEECWRIEMLRRGHVLVNSWKTGRCVDTNNPMLEIAFIKQYAQASDEQMMGLVEIDKQRAFRLVFSG